MKHLFILIFLFTASVVIAQRSAEVDMVKKKLDLANNSLYIFCRGTKSKSKLIADKFNRADTNITHIGLGVVDNEKLLIYNVTDDNETHESALRVDLLESFVGSPNVYYLSVWKCDLNLKEFKKIIKACENYAGRRIFFDASFNISNDDTLYCSEFCALILKKTNPRKFEFKPEFIKLNNKLLESILGREYLSYFPVDFFEVNKHFHKAFEYKFME